MFTAQNTTTDEIDRIDDVDPDDDYTCPACDGEVIMKARHRNALIAAHFAHKNGCTHLHGRSSKRRQQARKIASDYLIKKHPIPPDWLTYDVGVALETPEIDRDGVIADVTVTNPDTGNNLAVLYAEHLTAAQLVAVRLGFCRRGMLSIIVLPDDKFTGRKARWTLKDNRIDVLRIKFDDDDRPTNVYEDQNSIGIREDVERLINTDRRLTRPVDGYDEPDDDEPDEFEELINGGLDK